MPPAAMPLRLLCLPSPCLPSTVRELGTPKARRYRCGIDSAARSMGRRRNGTRGMGWRRIGMRGTGRRRDGTRSVGRRHDGTREARWRRVGTREAGRAAARSRSERKQWNSGYRGCVKKGRQGGVGSTPLYRHSMPDSVPHGGYDRNPWNLPDGGLSDPFSTTSTSATIQKYPPEPLRAKIPLAPCALLEAQPLAALANLTPALRRFYTPMATITGDRSDR